MNLTINARTIPHSKQRYETVGDWHYERADDELIITVWMSRLQNINHTILLAMHEITEAYLCWQSGLSPKTVTDWDLQWPTSNDPGALPLCPYREEHQSGELMERMMARLLSIDWLAYEAALDGVSNATSRD